MRYGNVLIFMQAAKGEDNAKDETEDDNRAKTSRLERCEDRAAK